MHNLTIPDYNKITVTEATSLQNNLKGRLLLTTGTANITTIAGADISHNKYEETVYAGIVILSYPGMALISYSLIQSTTKFPYIPGYLGFREVPALLQAWQQIPVKPNVVVLDGQGITHPRRMGIASHFGLLAETAAIGCAKNMLFGEYPALGNEKFSYSPITKYNELLGYALRTKAGVKPVFISPGHKISVEDSLTIMTNCVKKHRIPEPTRLAHDYVNLLRTGKLSAGFHKVDIQESLF
ncbi:deoxyribonuclease V [Flavobacterium rhizosphaerae]|uniref:Endonuclease V n=1 Tax=Flavobacterium rhizosphaerae TaxID=3163298 RepID=A0ABW8YW57_9FLAO